MGPSDRLLERDGALERLGAAVQSASGGVGRFVLVTGEAGIGKTTLVRRFAEGATGVRTLWGGCDDLTVPEPLAPILDLAQEAGGALAAAAERGEPREVARALRDELAAEVPTLCVIEDCHWADEATLDAIAHVARRIRRLGAVLLVTARDDDPEDRLRAVVGSLPSEDVVRIALGPLSPAAVEALAGDATLHAATGGNPFLVTEVAAATGETVPASVRDAVTGRAARLSPEARAALELVSVVPGRAELWLVGDPAAIAECERAALLTVTGETAGFRHELARLAYRESLPAGRRLELNRAVLRALEERGTDPARLVHHADAAQDAEALTRYAIVAAKRAAAAEAMALYSLALRGDLAPAERAAACEALAGAAYTEGRADVAMPAAREALALRRELADPTALGSCLRRLARLHWWSGSRSEAEAAAAEAVAVLEPLLPSRELAMALSTRSQLAMLAQLEEEAIALGERAIALSRALGDVETLVHAQTNVGTALVLSDPEGGRELLREAGETALAAGLDEGACRAFHNLASTAHDHRRLALAREGVERALEVARDTEQSWFEADTVVLGAVLDITTGRWAAATAAVEALAGLPAITDAPATWVLAAVELRQGGSQAHELVDEAWKLAGATDELQWVRPAACLRAEAAWLAGDPAAVDAATRDVYAVALERGHGWDVGELAVWRRRGGVLGAPPDGCAEPYALSLAGRWEAAARAWEEIGAPYERALALCDADTPELLLAGLELLDGLGAQAPARVVRRRLQALGVRSVPRGPRPATRAHPAGLSARQAEVLGLLAEGRTNPEIAKTLFLTPKTVEHHVTAILRKLRADSRAEAVEAAHKLGI